MNALLIYVVFAFIVFVSILLFAFKNTEEETADAAALIAVGEMVRPESLSRKTADQIFNARDYRLLRSNPALSVTARRFRRERRRIALMWFCLLREDLRKLHRFRGFLVQSGLSTSLSEEIQVGYQLCCAVIALNLMKMVVFVFGPFALEGFSRRARLPIEGMSRASAKLLNRLPSSQWQSVAREWQACSPSSRAAA